MEEFLIPRSENPTELVRLLSLMHDRKDLLDVTYGIAAEAERIRQEGRILVERSIILRFVVISLIPFVVSSVFAFIGWIRAGVFATGIGLIVIVAILSFIALYYSSEESRLTENAMALNNKVNEISRRFDVLWNQSELLLRNYTSSLTDRVEK